MKPAISKLAGRIEQLATLVEPRPLKLAVAVYDLAEVDSAKKCVLARHIAARPEDQGWPVEWRVIRTREKMDYVPSCQFRHRLRRHHARGFANRRGMA